MSQETRLRVLQDLRVISRLRENDRVKVQGGSLDVDAPSWYGSLARWGRGDNRNKSVATLTNLFENGLAFLEESKDEATKQAFVRGLAEGLIGVNRMRTTYRDDAKIVASLEILETSVRMQARALGYGLQFESPEIKLIRRNVAEWVEVCEDQPGNTNAGTEGVVGRGNDTTDLADPSPSSASATRDNLAAM